MLKLFPLHFFFFFKSLALDLSPL